MSQSKDRRENILLQIINTMALDLPLRKKKKKKKKRHFTVVFVCLPKLGSWDLPLHIFLGIQVSPPHSLPEIEEENTFQS